MYANVPAAALSGWRGPVVVFLQSKWENKCCTSKCLTAKPHRERTCHAVAATLRFDNFS